MDASHSDSSECGREILNQIENIYADDLSYIEKDLSFSEKVSIAFLLFGNTKANNLFALQKLLALYKSPNVISDLLFNFARENKKSWKFCLVEALAIIKSHKILRKLGINRYEYEVTFLPYRPETSVRIHPVLKALYFICEDLSLSETQALIFEIKKQTSRNYFDFSNPSFLEIYLLEWMTSSIITVGQWPQFNDINKKPNVEIIKNFLKKYEKDALKGILESACKYLNDTWEQKEISLNNKIQNLSIQPESISGASSFNDGQTEIDNFTVNDSYKIDRESAGFVLIINEYKFYEETDPSLKSFLPDLPFKHREGSEKDRDTLKETFEKFGYKSHIENNLTHTKILATIRNCVKKSIAYDSLVICILSHGLEGVVYGANSIPVRISEIENILASSKELYTKPKVLIIQACQGIKMQEADSLEYDSPIEDLRTYRVTSNDGRANNISRGIKSDKVFLGDILTVISTVKGYASYRDKIDGSWFIQTLCEKINALGNRRHFQDIVTSVINEVSGMKSKQNLCMVPQQHSTLRKAFWLPRSS